MKDWETWRHHQRKRIVTTRTAVSSTLRQQWSGAITELLINGFPGLKQMKIGLYWPFRGEYDPREAGLSYIDSGAILALPEVAGKDKPLCFRQWRPGAPMAAGAYSIPVPVGTPLIEPDALIVPMVGFDKYGYRLGYGGGFFDRTLVAYTSLSYTIGVAFEIQRLDNVYPQAHDIAMQYIVTECGIFKPGQ